MMRWGQNKNQRVAAMLLKEVNHHLKLHEINLGVRQGGSEG